jgi:hypothetical protein
MPLKLVAFVGPFALLYAVFAGGVMYLYLSRR